MVMRKYSVQNCMFGMFFHVAESLFPKFLWARFLMTALKARSFLNPGGMWPDLRLSSDGGFWSKQGLRLLYLFQQVRSPGSSEKSGQ